MKLAITLLVVALSVDLVAGACRSHASCGVCLQDPACGWCATYNDCSEGTKEGPTVGTCADWDFVNCTSPTPPSPTPPSPTPMFANWPMFGGSASHTGFRNITLGTSFSQLWRSSYGQKVTTASVIYKDKIFATGATQLMMGVSSIVALNIADGSTNFTTVLGNSASISPPAILNGYAYVQIVGDNEGIRLFKVSTVTGSIIWEVDGNCQWPSYPYGAVPDALSDNVFAPSGEYNGQVMCVSSKGNLTYTASLYPTGFGADAWTPTLWEGTPSVFYWVAGNGEGVSSGLFGASSKSDGQTLWSVELSSTGFGYSTQSVAPVADGVALTSLANEDGKKTLIAIDVIRRKKMWSLSCDLYTGTFTGSFPDLSAATDGKEVAYTCGHQLQLYDINTGNMTSNFYCGDCFGQPIMTKTAVIVQSTSSIKIFPRDSSPPVSISETGSIALAGNVLFITNLQTFGVVGYVLY